MGAGRLPWGSWCQKEMVSIGYLCGTVLIILHFELMMGEKQSRKGSQPVLLLLPLEAASQGDPQTVTKGANPAAIQFGGHESEGCLWKGTRQLVVELSPVGGCLAAGVADLSAMAAMVRDASFTHHVLLPNALGRVSLWDLPGQCCNREQDTACRVPPTTPFFHAHPLLQFRSNLSSGVCSSEPAPGSTSQWVPYRCY